MLRFIRNKRKGKKGGDKSGVVAQGNCSGGDTGSSDAAIVLTSVRSIEPEEAGATKYRGDQAGSNSVQEDTSAELGETVSEATSAELGETVSEATSAELGETVSEDTSAELGETVSASPAVSLQEAVDESGAASAACGIGAEMEPILEESVPIQQGGDAQTNLIAAENPYAYPEGDGEGGDDWESVVTVIETSSPGHPETNFNDPHTYATVCKPNQRLKSKAEQLDDRYTPDKELLEVARQQRPDTSEDERPSSAEQVSDDNFLSPGEREEDYVIYVTKDSLHRPNIRRSPVIEAPLSTFDSPERQSIRDHDRERLLQFERLRQQPDYDLQREMEREKEWARLHAHENYPEYIRQRSAPSDVEEYRYVREYPSDDGIIVRRSPSGAFIQRTQSFPKERYGRHCRHTGAYSHGPRPKCHRHGYPPRPRRHHPSNYPNPYIPPYKGRPRENGHFKEYLPHDVIRPHGYPAQEDGQRNGFPVQENGYPGGKVPQANGHLPYMSKDVRVQSNKQPRVGRNSPPEVAQNEPEVHHDNQPGETRVSFKNEDEVNEDRKSSASEENAGKEKAALLSEEDAISVGTTASDMSEDDLRPRRLLIRRSIAIFFAWFCMGFCTEVVGPNIPYLQARVNGTYVDIAHALAFRGAGMVVGSTVGGLLCEVSPNWLDLWISTSLLLGALSTAAVPWSLHVIHLSVILGLGGFSKGFLQVATLTVLMRLWSKTGATTVVFIVHVAYAIGALPTPQLAYLFETGVLEKLMFGENATSAPPSYHAGQSNGHYPVASHAKSLEGDGDNLLSLLDYIPRPMYPFDFGAVLTFVCGAVFLMFFGSAIRSVPQVRAVSKKLQEIEMQPLDGLRPRKWFLPKATCGLRPILFLLIFFVLHFAVMATFGTFLHICASRSSLTFRNADALLLQTTFWAAVAVGRIIAPIASRCMAANGLVIACFTMSTVSTALLAVYGEQYPIFTWIFTASLGVFSGPIIPAALTFCNLWLGPTAMGFAVAFFWFGIGDGAFSWVSGYLLYKFAPKALVFMCLAASGASFLLYLPIIPLLAKQKRKRNTKKKKLKGKVVE